MVAASSSINVLRSLFKCFDIFALSESFQDLEIFAKLPTYKVDRLATCAPRQCWLQAEVFGDVPQKSFNFSLCE